MRISGSSGHLFRYGPATHFSFIRPPVSASSGEFLTAVDGQMKLHGLTHVTKVVNSVGYTSDAVRAMSDDSLIQLLGAARLQQLALGLIS